MSKLSKENPFLRCRLLSGKHSEPRKLYFECQSTRNSSWIDSSNPSMELSNPFEKSRFDSVFSVNRKSNRTSSLYRYHENKYSPLTSKYKNSVKLKELDT